MYDVRWLLEGNIVYRWNTRIADNEENEDVEKSFDWIFNSNDNSLDEPTRFFLIMATRVIMIHCGMWYWILTIVIIFFHVTVTLQFLLLTLSCVT